MSTASDAKTREHTVMYGQTTPRGLLAASSVTVALFAAITFAAVSVASASSMTSPARRALPAMARTATIARCHPNLANDLAQTRGAAQIITVESTSYSATVTTLVAWRRVGHCWVRHFGPWASRIGFAGFSDHKVEGDGATPTGIYRIGGVLYGNAPNPGVHFFFHPIVCGDWWDEDPSSPAYNRFVHIPCGAPPPFGGTSEPLWKEGHAYPILAFIEYNASPVLPGRGSAIFLHADVGGPTSGCITVHLPELDALMRWLEPRAHPVIVMGPRAEIERF